MGSHMAHAFIQAIETVALSCFISGVPIGKHAVISQTVSAWCTCRPMLSAGEYIKYFQSTLVDEGFNLWF